MTQTETEATLLDEAERLLSKRAYERAHALCMRALDSNPHAARAFFLLGILAADHNNPGKAAELFERALHLAPGDARANAFLAKTFLALSQPEEARRAAERAAALNPSDAITLDTIGVVFSRTGLHDRALGFFARATTLAPANAMFCYNLAAAAQFLGDFDRAAEAYERAIARDPGLVRAYSALVQLKKQTPQGNHLAALQRLFNADNAETALHIGHAIAKTFEDMGDYDKALAWLARAKAPRLRELGAGPFVDEKVFAAAAQTANGAGRGDPSPAPIFVIGLPRTGTTLVDRILSSHRDVASVGELGAFSTLVKRMSGTRSNLVLDEETLHAGKHLDFPALGAGYIEAARPLARGKARFVDKMPLNFFYAGLIAKALPNARIICLRRDAMDAALSNYRQLFATSFTYYNYAFSLEDTARYVVAFERLIAHFRSALPAERFTEVRYEDLVANQEGETRRLLAFCDLDWDPACLAFHENTAAVATASSVQVRQPLYATSIGRWRRYSKGLEGAAHILRGAGIWSGD